MSYYSRSRQTSIHDCGVVTMKLTPLTLDITLQCMLECIYAGHEEMARVWAIRLVRRVR